MIALISVCESFTPKCEILLSTFAQAWEESCHLTPASFYRSHKRHRYNLIAQVFCGPPLQARRTVFGLEKIVQGFLSLGNLSEYFIAVDIARFKKLMCNLREVRRQRERGSLQQKDFIGDISSHLLFQHFCLNAAEAAYHKCMLSIGQHVTAKIFEKCMTFV